MDFTAAHLEQLCACAEAAGREVMDVYCRDFAVRMKDDQPPVTDADHRADRVIRECLQEAFPGIFVLSEESCCTSDPGHGPEWWFLVDPLDGTREFIQRNGEFTVNIALIHRGAAVAGVVLVPALGQIYYAAQGRGAFRRDASGVSALRTAAWKSGAPLRVMASRSHGGDALEKWLAQLPANKVLLSAGSSLKFCRIAEGAADLYPRLSPTCQWDTAAAQAVLEEAGGQVLDATGQPLRYGPDRPMLNAHFIAVGDSRIAYPALH